MIRMEDFMYITAATYGGIDWHDSRTINEQLKRNGSYNIDEALVPEAIADDIQRLPLCGRYQGKSPAGALRKILLSVYDQV